jgi:hypothetical protein
MINHYKIFGLPNYSNWTDVRKAYIQEIKKYHPDLNSSEEAIDICKQLNVAKEALETNIKKVKYDTRLKWHLSYGQRSSQSTTTSQPRTRRRYSPPVTRKERARRSKEYRDKVKLAEYVRGLEKFPLNLRYLLCGVYGLFGLYILGFTVFNLPVLAGIFFGVITSVLWFSATTIFINEYYKYYDYISRTSPLNFDLDKRSVRMLTLIYLGGFVFCILIKLVVQ